MFRNPCKLKPSTIQGQTKNPGPDTAMPAIEYTSLAFNYLSRDYREPI